MSIFYFIIIFRPYNGSFLCFIRRVARHAPSSDIKKTRAVRTKSNNKLIMNTYLSE